MEGGCIIAAQSGVESKGTPLGNKDDKLGEFP